MIHSTAQDSRINLSSDEYLHLVAVARSRDEPVPTPSTLEHLRALHATYPHLSRRYMPPRDEAERLGFILDVEPFDERWRHALLATLDHDPEFAKVLARKLGVK